MPAVPMNPQNSQPSPERLVAPWSDEQVAALNLFQRSGIWHSFTSENGGDLIATREGWVAQEGGPIVQDWAHPFMANQPLIEAEMARRSLRTAHLRSDDLSRYESSPIFSEGSDLRGIAVETPDGFYESICWIAKGDDKTLLHVLTRNLAGAHAFCHIQLVDAEGRLPRSAERATNITVKLSYLPKMDPTMGERAGNFDFMLRADELSAAKELALLFGYSVNEGMTALQAAEVLNREATSRGIRFLTSSTSGGEMRGAAAAD